MKKLISKFTLLFLIMCMFVVGAVAGCNGDGDNNDDDTPTFKLLLSDSNINTVVGDEYTIIATNVSESAELNWTSSNENVAKVKDGKVEAVSEGSATITATYLEYTATCTVNVTFSSQIPQLLVKNSSKVFTIGKRQGAFPFEVSVLFNGKEYTDVNVTCSSAGNIVNFDEDGNIVPTGELGTETVYLTGTWRGVSVDRFPSLMTKITVKVVNEMFFWVNGEPLSNVTLNTLTMVDNGTSYVNEMNFDVQGFFNGVEVDSSQIEVSVPSFVKFEDGKIKGLVAGEGKIYLSYRTSENEVLQQAIDIIVNRVTLNYTTVIDYFSSNTGTFKDHNDGWKNKSVIDAVFNGIDVEDLSLSTMTAKQNGKQLVIEDGKLLNLAINYDGEYATKISFESDTVYCDVNMVVYGLVIKEAQDLKNLELKVIKSDDPLTFGVDETQVTCIDGYVALLNSIDATGVKIEHTAMTAKYIYRKADNDAKIMTITPSRYHYGTANRKEVVDHITGKFGFIGNFDGRGNTIFNLDVSTTPDDDLGGGGLFGWTIGKVNIANVAFRDLKCSYGCGVVNQAKSYGGHNTDTDPLDLRIGAPTYTNIYVHISGDTVAPKGAFMGQGAGGSYNAISNVIIDATDVKLDGATNGSLFVSTEGATCPWNSSNGYYYSCENIYIISPEFPVYFSESVTILGANHAEDDSWLRLPLSMLPEDAPDKTRFSPDFYTYKSYAELVTDNHDFSTFSSSWMLSNYPIFKSSKQVIATYDEVVKFDNEMILSTTDNTRDIALTSFTEGTIISDISFSDYDEEKLSISLDGEVGKIKLTKAISTLSGEKTTVTVNYKINGKTQSMTLNFLLMPSLIEVDKTDDVVSAFEFYEYIKEDMIDGQVVKSVKQTIDGEQEVDITVSEGEISPLNVKINAEKDGVVNSTVVVETFDLTYKFANVTAYSHIIRNGEDLKIFEQPTDVAENSKYGYYILANNIDATGITLNHADLLKNNDRYHESKAYFQGILDGQGYAISNFDSRMSGLLRAVRSDTENQAIIKDLAFTNMLYSGEVGHGANSGFTIFGYQVKGSSNAKVIIQNVHVEIAEVGRTTGFESTALYKGLFSHNMANMDGIKLENVYINIINEDTPIALGSGEGTLFSTDVGLRGSSKEQRENSGRFTNVVTISDLNPSLHANSNQTLEQYWAGYFAYPENMIGEDGIIRVDRKDASIYRYTKVDKKPIVVDGELKDNVNPALFYYMSKQAIDDIPAEYSRAFDDDGNRVAGVTDDTDLFYYHNSDHPLVTDDPEQHCYIYYGVYKYAEEYDVDADKLALFTATGLWELVDKEFTIGEGADAQTITKQVLEWKSVIPA